jgi:hypothetical protein
VIIPASDRWVTNLAQRRRGTFRDHVNRLIGEAGAGRAASCPSQVGPPAVPLPSEAAEPGVQAVLGRECAVCRGSGCRQGGNHAFLTVATIRRYMSQHPEHRPRDVLAAYLGRVGNKTFEGSCIVHQPGGCSLPRDMRSDTCNRFVCRSLTEFRQGLTGPDPPRGFFVSMSGDKILGAAFCDEETFAGRRRVVGLRIAPRPPYGVGALRLPPASLMFPRCGARCAQRRGNRSLTASLDPTRARRMTTDSASPSKGTVWG